jgi:two-component system, OmpR family, phosphate regulon sensor histidine kinase PhoR
MMRRAPPLARILLGSLVLTLPAAVVLAVLAWTETLAPGTAALAILAVYAGVVLLSGPLFSGLAQVKAALQALAQGAATLPDIVTLSPTARELGRDVGRFARAHRETIAESADARASAESVLAALPEPLLLIDPERRIVSANPSALELLGPRLAGRDLGAALRAPAVLEATDAVLAGGDGRTVEVDLPGSVERHLSAQVGPLRPPTSEGAAAVLTLTDITASKRSERMRQDFVANASHELRTPLATLLGFIETLRGPARDDNAARERFLSIMAEQASRMSRLVDDLLSLSRIELNEHLAPKERVDLRRLLMAVADSLEQRAEKRQMRIEVALPEALPDVVGDPDELAQVFQNLMDNAIKYGRSGTAVEVSAAASARRLAGAPAAQVAIRDHGEGILTEHIPRLTERFYRVDPARSRELGGTGLGLAIVKHIVAHHRGSLEIESELGEGSVFTVHLPVVEPPEVPRV